MPVSDVKADYSPRNLLQIPVGPTVAAMRTALSTYNSTSYSSKTLDTMTERDCYWACKQHGLSVAGL